MKTRFRKILSLISLVLLCFSLTLSGGANKSAARAVGETGELVSSESLDLIYSPKFVSSNDTCIFIYDDYLGEIRAYSKLTNALRETSNKLALNSVCQIAASGDLLFVLTNAADDEKLTAFDASTLTQVASFSSASTTPSNTTLKGALDFKVKEIDAQKKTIVVSKFNEADGSSFEVLNVILDGTQWAFASSRVTIDNKSHEFDLGEKVQDFALLPSETAECLNLIAATKTSAYYVEFNHKEQSHSYLSTEILQVKSSVTAGNEIVGVRGLTQDENTYLAIIGTKKSLLFSGLVTAPTLTQEISRETSANTRLGGSDTDAFLADAGNQQVIEVKLTNAATSLEFVTRIKNDELTKANLSITDLGYFKAENGTLMFASPFVREPDVTVPAGAHVVKIATIKIGSAAFDEFTYCLYTNETGNHYGFIKTATLTPLDASTYSKTVIKVFSNTSIFSLPSTSLDAVNTKLATFSGVTTLYVATCVCNDNFIGAGSKFLLVETEDGQMGFVDMARIANIIKTKTLITGNAKTRCETRVYSQASTSSEILDVISKDTRVKIEDGQKTNAQFLKVTYNTAEGDLVTGYILTDDLARDTWTVLQVIGLVFVGLNVIFLIVLLLVKKKINHD